MQTRKNGEMKHCIDTKKEVPVLLGMYQQFESLYQCSLVVLFRSETEMDNS